MVDECCTCLTSFASLDCAGELEEMVDLYKEKGVDEADARKLIMIMARHKDFFLDHMMVEVCFQPIISHLRLCDNSVNLILFL